MFLLEKIAAELRKKLEEIGYEGFAEGISDLGDNSIITESNVSGKAYFFTYKLSFFDDIEEGYVDCEKDEQLFLEIASLKKGKKSLKEKAILYIDKYSQGRCQELIHLFGKKMFDELILLGHIELNWGKSKEECKQYWVWTSTHKCTMVSDIYKRKYFYNLEDCISYIVDKYHLIKYKIKLYFQLYYGQRTNRQV